MSEYINNKLEIENARILFKNFTGAPSDFNREGVRNFSVIIEDEDYAKHLLAEGWNIKTLAAKDEHEEALYTLPVEIRFDNIPPNIFMIADDVKTELDETTIQLLQYARIVTMDLVISPYNWSLASGKSGVKAYLQTMYAVVEQDRFANKYR